MICAVSVEPQKLRSSKFEHVRLAFRKGSETVTTKMACDDSHGPDHGACVCNFSIERVFDILQKSDPFIPMARDMLNSPRFVCQVSAIIVFTNNVC